MAVNGNAALLSALLGAWICDHAPAEAAVKAAIDASIKDNKIQDAAKKDKDSAWNMWLAAGQTLANEGADSALAAMVIESLTGDDTIAVESVKTYKSRVSSLVPILAKDDAAYAELWNKAGISDSKGPLEPTRVFHNQIAAKLIKAAKNEAPTMKDRVNAGLKLITSHIKGIMSPDVESLDTEQAKKDARAEGVNNAMELVNTLLGILSIDDGQLPVVPEDSAETAEQEQDDAPRAAVG